MGYLSRLWRSSQLVVAGSSRLSVTFWHGVMLQFVNIKAWMHALTIVGAWIAGTDDAARRFALVLPVVPCSGLAGNFTFALTGSLSRQWLAKGKRLLVCTAIWMMIA